MTLKDIYALIPGIYEYYFIEQDRKSLQILYCRCNQEKDLEMGR